MNKLSCILIFLGVVGILDTIVVFIAGGGYNFGSIFPGLLGLILILYYYYGQKIKRMMGDKGKMIWIIGKVLLTIWLISFVIIEFLIISASPSEEQQPVDYLMVLGAGLKGQRLSLTLEERLKTSLAYLENHPNMQVIVSGGKGMGESISEADAMANYLVSHGIAEDRIIKEDKSTSTLENLRFTKLLLDKTQGKRTYKILITSSDYHLFRAKLLAKRVGITAYGLPATTPIYVLPNSYFREYLAVIKSYLLDR